MNDSDILDTYRSDEDCHHVLQTRFVHPPVTSQERLFPIAFGFTVYKNARLFERILQAIYMPSNVYCVHIDKKSPEVFRKAIQAMIRCLPNVFIASNSVDVNWGHITLVQAHISCMKELLKSSVKWRYYINLTGQGFPLYNNMEIVRALQNLNNFNNIASRPMPEKFENRTKFVHKLKNGGVCRTSRPKLPPPHIISIYKGSTFIVAIREFVKFVLYDKIGKDFVEFLNDTAIPDETLYASLQQHPLTPGGIRGRQRCWISRALHWKRTGVGGASVERCHGTWVRHVCWISIKDLRWVLGQKMKDKLFVHKIPFDFNDDLLECIFSARQGRKYRTAVYMERTKKHTNKISETLI